jgi:predicted TIM-barrel fold metal-dependent hydrolase
LDIHNVALRHPQVRFIIPHFGAGFLREALMLADLCPNVYLDTSSSNAWMKYSEAPLDLVTVFRRTLAVTGTRRLLFGTDSSFFPRGWVRPVFEAQAVSLAGLGLNAEEASSIFGGNLLSLQQ